MHSLERLQGYIEIEQEPKPTSAGVPPAYWPSSGALDVKALSARYSPTGPKVLEDITFSIKAGERVGVGESLFVLVYSETYVGPVGRTGSGKSSLTLSLLRCIYTDGTVLYDGLPTSGINLDLLRRNITIIPQVVSEVDYVNLAPSHNPSSSLSYSVVRFAITSIPSMSMTMQR